MKLLLIDNLKHGIMITLFVFVMMMLIDYLNVLTKGNISKLIKGGRFRQYFISSFLGSTPGCIGAFMNVSFYIRGLISIGCVAGGMIATSGDEAFVMLSLFPGKAVILFGILFIIGIASAYLIDKIVPLLKINTCSECKDSYLHEHDDCKCLNFKESIQHIKNISFVRFLLISFFIAAIIFLFSGIIGPQVWDWKRVIFLILMVFALFIIITVPDHYLIKHIWEHIFKKHLWKIFIWSFGILLLVDIGLNYWNLEAFVASNMLWVFLIAGFAGLIPESGPHLLFVMLFLKGLIPFSILLTSSIIQDGHGMIPLLSYTIKDSLLIKVFNLFIGFAIGCIVYAIGY